MDGQYRDIVVFVTLYLLLSLPPFLYFNREIIGAVRDRIAPDVVTIAVVGTLSFAVLSALVLGRAGIDRYNRFLFAPTDALSVLVGVSFFFAAVSWWLVPELAFRFDADAPLDLLLSAVIFCQIPMVLFLSLLTVLGTASGGRDRSR